MANSGDSPSDPLLPVREANTPSSTPSIFSKENRRKLIKLVLVLAAVTIAVFAFIPHKKDHHGKNGDQKDWCPGHEIIRPSSYLNNNSYLDVLKTEKFQKASLKKFSGAIQIPTESYDNLKPVGEDARWNIFYKFSAYLKETFPVVYKNLKFDRVNTHGLVYTWEGSNKDLKPLLLMSHQDVVPVLGDTLDKWDYPPYAAEYDGKYVHGRGTVDTKNSLIAILEATEHLISKGFEPERSVVIAYGFDEEISGRNGGRNIGKHLLEKYGEDSFFAVLDEGNAGVIVKDGISLALPATGEKGYFDAAINLATPGGHSSIPPPHTSIGIMSELIVEIDSTPYTPIFTPVNPFFVQMQCLAKHSSKLSNKVRDAILDSEHDAKSNEIAIEYIQRELDTRFLVQTTQATDIIKGGIKANALPESVTAVVNHRISIESSVNATQEKLIGNIAKIAELHNLDFEAFGVPIITKNNGVNGIFNLTLFGPALEPAPVSPTQGLSWDILAGTIRHIFEDYTTPIENGSKEIIVGSSIMTGNTDTRWMWPLTRNIYRYLPFKATAAFNMHTVNEKLEFEAHIDSIAFYTEYIQNVDAARE
ncbi:carboxypeptidase S [Nadsonia fulvescens var. elongata DSM 6958]|uniref:Carboxypeptidase S n=1 Tax=Nadsonia fulvescens var. elongata DSM 6958 TaxID=857566 RepID=A0A1E3PRD7_9ASCO|nr:carboxypeptidase S [Nadsonia fulvescens var. elongata DSM 6958]